MWRTAVMTSPLESRAANCSTISCTRASAPSVTALTARDWGIAPPQGFAFCSLRLTRGPARRNPFSANKLPERKGATTRGFAQGAAFEPEKQDSVWLDEGIGKRY